MKYLFEKELTYSCLYEDEINQSKISSKFVKTSESNAVAMDYSTNSLTEERKFYQVYTSPYSGAFDLLDTLRIPRACAYESQNMTQLDYFYGQRQVTYDMKQNNMAKVASKMDDEVEFIFQNGTNA